MTVPARLLSLATALPGHVLEQRAVAEMARQVFAGRLPEYDRLAQVFETAGIERRYAVRPLEWYREPRDWPQRTEAYLEEGGALFCAAAGQALRNAGLAAADIGTVVTVSSTGIATPSLEARAADSLGLPLRVRRVPVFGLGCAGGVSGLGLAARLAEAEPGRAVLLVVVELCTLSFRPDLATKANLVATALFGDGAAACVLRAEVAGEKWRDDATGRPAVEATGEHRWPDTLDVMGWTVDPSGFGVVFDRAIPPFVEANAGEATDLFLDTAGIDRRNIARFLFHPGGVKVIAALESALGLADGTLDHERRILAEHGNMSAPTALFVLERALDARVEGRILLTAMGPGFTASFVSLAPV